MDVVGLEMRRRWRSWRRMRRKRKLMRKGRGSIFKNLGSRWICWARPTRGRTTTWGGAGPKQWAAKWEPEGLKIPRWETQQGNLLHPPWPSGLHPSAVFFPTSEAARRREATSRRWCAGFGIFRWLDAIDTKKCLDAMCWVLSTDVPDYYQLNQLKSEEKQKDC